MKKAEVATISGVHIQTVEGWLRNGSRSTALNDTLSVCSPARHLRHGVSHLPPIKSKHYGALRRRSALQPLYQGSSSLLMVAKPYMLRRYWPPTSYSAVVICPSEQYFTASTSTANTLPFSMTVCCSLASHCGA